MISHFHALARDRESLLVLVTNLFILIATCMKTEDLAYNAMFVLKKLKVVLLSVEQNVLNSVAEVLVDDWVWLLDSWNNTITNQQHNAFL